MNSTLFVVAIFVVLIVFAILAMILDRYVHPTKKALAIYMGVLATFIVSTVIFLPKSGLIP